MFCPECGKKNEEGTKFCPDCGNSLIDKQDKQKPVGEASWQVLLRQAGRKKPIIIGAVVVIALIISVFVFMQNNTTIPRGGGSKKVTRTTEFTFKPESSGVWSFETTDVINCIPYLVISFSQGRLPMIDGRLEYELTKGETYTIRAGFLNDRITGTGNYILLVEKLH
jgi:hypothetical protein